MKILSPEQDHILQQERIFLNELRVNLVGCNANRDDLDALGQSIRQLDDLFLLVVVGEFNAGKSAFINALLGKQYLKEGVTPTTSRINLLRYGEPASETLAEDHYLVHHLPVGFLTEITIVDTPGTNAVIRQHEELTTHFVPRADLVLFLTSVDRPFTESERSFMEQIRNWGKKVIIILNKIDLLQDEAELLQVETFVRENATHLLGTTPEIFPVSSRLALRAKNGEPSLWAPSRFEALESYIHNTLDQGSQVRLKFLNPLGIGAYLVEKYARENERQKKVLEQDAAMLQNVERQQQVYRTDMKKTFSLRMAEIENIFYEMEQRGEQFFEDRFRLAQFFHLMNKEQMQEEFEQEVVGDVSLQVDARVNELIDWLVESDLRQWKAVTSYLADRQREYRESLIGEDNASGFHYDRSRLLDAIGREADRVVESYDRHAESLRIATGAQNAVVASAAVGIGAVGLGTVVTILATTMAADITGILAAGVIAALGLFIIPARRRQAKRELQEKLASLRRNLTQSLHAEFEKEITRSTERIDQAITPYTRFVRSEIGRTDQVEMELSTASLEIQRIRAIVESW